MKITVLTLGCKVNQSESSEIEGILIKKGHSIVHLTEKPDYCVVNTCTVTAKSDYHSRQLIRRAHRTGAKVIVTGCYATLNKSEICTMDGIERVISNNNKTLLIKEIDNTIKSNKSYYSQQSRPYVKIQDGCDHACSYCIVPKARGKSKSLQQTEVINHVKYLENKGFNEIVLTGIHIGSYGKDLSPKSTFTNLLKNIIEKTRIPRIRISSLQISDMSEEFLELIMEKRICNHLHLPLQSGNDSILSKMNRPYTSKEYIKTFEEILKRIPGIAIGTDVIVGFPGENDKQFVCTDDILKHLPFAYIHVFPFSQRPDTTASSLKEQVQSTIKKARVKKINALSTEKRAGYASKQINKVHDVIVESKMENSNYIGRTGNYQKVKINSKECMPKELIYVKITEREGDILIGKPI